MSWDPFKDEGATRVGVAPEEFDPFKAGATRVKSDAPILKPDRARYDPEIFPPAMQAKVAVADWVERNYGILFEDTSKNYETTAKVVGLSGNPEADFKAFQHRETTLAARNHRIIKRHVNPQALDQIAEGVGQVVRAVPASAARAGFDAAAGTVDLANIVYELTNFTGMDDSKSRDAASGVAQWLRDMSEYSARHYGVDPDFERSLAGQFMQGGGTVAAGIGSLGASIPGQLYTEAIRDTEAETGLKFLDMSEDQQDATMAKGAIYVGIGTVLERTGLKYIGLGKLKGFLSGKVNLPNGYVVQALKAGAIEGGTESTQGQLLDTLAVAIEGSDRDLISFDVLKDRVADFGMGALIGTAATGGMRGVASLDAVSFGGQMQDIGAQIDYNLAREDRVRNPEDGTTPIDWKIAFRTEDEVEVYRKSLAETTDPQKAWDAVKEHRTEQLGEDFAVLPGVNQNLLKMMDPMAGATETDWKAARENFDEQEIFSNAMHVTGDYNMAYVAVKAARGDTEAQNAWVEGTTIDPESDPIEATKATMTQEEQQALDDWDTETATPDDQDSQRAAVESGESEVDQRNPQNAKRVATPLTVIEEVSEGDAKRAVESGKRRRLQKSAMKKLEAEVKKRIEAINRMKKERGNVEKAIKQLEGMVHKLPLPVRGKYRGFGKLAKVKTPEAQQRHLEQASRRLQNIFDQYFHRERRAELKKLLKPFATSRATKQQKLSSRFGKESRDILRVAVQAAKSSDVVKRPAGMSEEFFQDTVSMFDGVLLPDADINRVVDALRNVKELISGGRAELQKFRDAREERNRERNETIIDILLKGETPLDEQTLQDRVNRRGGVAKSVSISIDLLFHHFNGIQQHMNMMDGTKGGFLDHYFNDQVIVADQTSHTLQRQHKEAYVEAMEKIFGSAKKAHRWITMAKEKAVETHFVWRTNKTPETRKITRMQGVDILLKWGDKSQEATFEGMEIDAGLVEQVKAFVGPEGVALTEYLRGQYADLGLGMKAKYKETEGYEMDLVDGYGGRIYRAGVEKVSDDTMFEYDANGRPTVKSGSMKARTGSTKAILFNDALSEFERHVREVHHYISHATAAKDLHSSFFGNKDVSSAIKQRMGHDFHASLRKKIERVIAGNSGPISATGKAWLKARSNLSKASLGIKPIIALKQLTSAPAFAESVGLRNYGKAWGQMAANPMKWGQMVWQTDYVKNRLSTSMYADIQQAMEMKSTSITRGSASDYIMLNVKAGDIGAIIIGGTPVYIHHYQQAKAEGRTDSEAAEIAEMRFAAEAERAQQSSAMHSRGEYLQSNDFVLRGWFMYLSSPIQYQRNVNVALYNAARAVMDTNKGRPVEMGKAFKQLLRAFLIYHVLLPQIFHALGTGIIQFIDDDDETAQQAIARQYKALLLGNFNTLPLAGQFLSIIADLISGADETFTSTGNPLVDESLRLFQDFERFGKEVKDKDEAIAESLYKLIETGGELKGIPVGTGQSVYEAWRDIANGDTKYPAHRALLWSKWALIDDEN